MPKSTVDEIRTRFDNDVERFSNLETGQVAAIDSALCMDLVTEAAAVTTPGAKRVLDLGCGAGNYSIKLLQRLPGAHVTLVDLSRPMLDRAEQRLTAAGAGTVKTIQGDVRQIDLGDSAHDVILAAAVFHHLRDDAEWEAVFAKLHRALAPGGSVWIVDMIEATSSAVQRIMWRRYGEYLAGVRDEAFRDSVFAYIEKEDTPRPLMYQLDLLRRMGFRDVDVLHKNSAFAAFGAVK